jgi:dihydropyrimidine dehydrogenase (NAD+) subunit PreA
MANLITKLGSIEIENPIIVGSGYCTDTENAIAKVDKNGPGAIVLKSSLLDEEYRQVTKPCAPYRYPNVRNRFHYWDGNFIFGEAMSTKSLEIWADWLERNKRKFQSRIVASVIGISIEGRVKGAKLMEEAGADGIELGFGCPAPYFERFDYAATRDPHRVEDVCRAVKKAVRIPVSAKVSSHPPSLARAAHRAGVDWITIIGGQIAAASGINLDTLELLAPNVFAIGGLVSRKYALFSALCALQDISSRFHIAANGGIQGWQDIAELILYGASSIQAHSIFLMKGYTIIPKMKQGLLNYMDNKGFATLEDIRGAILPNILTYDEVLTLYSQTKGKIVARIDDSLCNGCAFCEEICGYDAIKMNDGIATVDVDLCEGCGLCCIDCATGAIQLENLSLMKKGIADKNS